MAKNEMVSPVVSENEPLTVRRSSDIGGNPGRHSVHIRPSLFRYAKAIEGKLDTSVEWTTAEFWTLALAILLWLRDHRHNATADNIATEWFAPGVDIENPTPADWSAAVENRESTLKRLIEGFDKLQAGRLHDEPGAIRALCQEFGEVLPSLYY